MKAKTKYVPEEIKHRITAGKEYEASGIAGGVFLITDNVGARLACLTKQCNWLDGKNWEILE